MGEVKIEGTCWCGRLLFREVVSVISSFCFESNEAEFENCRMTGGGEGVADEDGTEEQRDGEERRGVAVVNIMLSECANGSVCERCSSDDEGEEICKLCNSGDRLIAERSREADALLCIRSALFEWLAPLLRLENTSSSTPESSVPVSLRLPCLPLFLCELCSFLLPVSQLNESNASVVLLSESIKGSSSSIRREKTEQLSERWENARESYELGCMCSSTE